MRTKLRNREKVLLDVRCTQNIIEFKSGITRFKSSKSYMSNRDVITSPTMISSLPPYSE